LRVAAETTEKGRVSGTPAKAQRNQTQTTKAIIACESGGRIDKIRAVLQRDWTRELPTLTGPNVTVREVVVDDAPVLSELLTDALVVEHVSPPPQSVRSFEGFIVWSQQQRALGRGVCFGIVPNGLDAAVGIIQVRALDPTSSATMEWGFALAASFWGTGTFNEAANLVAGFAFDTMHVHRLEGRAVEANARGNAALHKLGAKPEGSLQRGFKRPRGYDTQIMWGLTADDWHNRPLVHERFLVSEVRTQIADAIATLREAMEAAAPRVRGTAAPHPFFLTGDTKREPE
jgi:ribosomal-protein-alanine N-acetyltransferase